MHREFYRRAAGFLARVLSRAILPATLALSPVLLPAPARGRSTPASTRPSGRCSTASPTPRLTSAAWLAADDDGDGSQQRRGTRRGHQPLRRRLRRSTSPPRRTNADGSMALTFPTVAGKLLRVQSNADLVGRQRLDDLTPALQIAGDGTPKTLTAPAPGSAQTFYRVARAGHRHRRRRRQRLGGEGHGLRSHHRAHPRRDGGRPHRAGQRSRAGKRRHRHRHQTDRHAAADASTAATDTATITITRGGTLHFSAITVPLNWSGTAVGRGGLRRAAGDRDVPAEGRRRSR